MSARSLVLVAVVLSTAPAASQVTLREKAQIDPASPRGEPGTESTEGFYSPCNPPIDDLGPPVITRRSVFPGSSLSLAALTCPYCPPHHMSGVLTEGAGFVRLELNRPSGLGGEINGDWFHFREAWGYDVHAVFDQAIPADSVVVRFTMTYVDFPPPNVEYIEIYYVRRMYTLNTRAEPAVVEQGWSADLFAWVADQCAEWHPSAHAVTARIVSGGERGQLKNPWTQELGQVLTDLQPAQGFTPTVIFQADGVDPDSTTNVEIEFTVPIAEVPPVRVTLPVRPGWSCPVVHLDPPAPEPGDTVSVTMQRMKLGGILTEYPAGQLFSVMLYPDEAGTLSSPHRPDTSDYFDAVPAGGLVWLAAPEVEEESVNVYLWVNALVPGEGTGESDEDRAGAERLRITTGRLNSFTPPSGPTEQDVCNAAWGVLWRSLRLELLRPPDSLGALLMSSEPQMPEIVCEARLRGFSGGTVIFGWSAHLQWTNDADQPDRHFRSLFEGQSNAVGSDTSRWFVDWDDKVRGGVAETLSVNVQVGGKRYQALKRRPFSVLGKNPPVSDVKAGLNVDEQVIVFMESYPKWCHFSEGLPIFGAPHGYGLMQLDNPRATDEQVWNWRENRDAGVLLFADKRNEALAFPGRIRARARSGKLPIGFQNATDFSNEEQLLKEAFQRYNGGTYWNWVPARPNDPQSPGRWRPRGNANGYGDRAWGVRSMVQAGTPPHGWN